MRIERGSRDRDACKAWKCGADLVARVVEEYFERARRGEHPRLEEFVERYPEISDLLRTVIPGLQAAEQPADVAANGNVANQRHRQIGDFRILRQIRRGGMGIVYEAEQISMNRRVALKVLPLAGLVDELKIRRFQNEVRAVAALDHPTTDLGLARIESDVGVTMTGGNLCRASPV